MDRWYRGILHQLIDGTVFTGELLVRRLEIGHTLPLNTGLVHQLNAAARYLFGGGMGEGDQAQPESQAE